MSKRVFLKVSLILCSMSLLLFSGCLQKKNAGPGTALIEAVPASDNETASLTADMRSSVNDLSGIKKELFYVTEDKSLFIEMIKIPGQNYAVSSTEITQAVYESVTGDNPSENYNSTPECPVDSVNWYDAVVFCNRLSLLAGLTPVYSVSGSVNPDEWEYEAHGGQSVTKGSIEWNREADGFRLPSEEEWIKAAAESGQELDDCAWYYKNSSSTPHEVSLKKQNPYGLFDIYGNVWEWVWDYYPGTKKYRMYKGGSCTSDKELCSPYFRGHHYPSRYSMNYSYWWFGIRVAKNVSK